MNLPLAAAHTRLAAKGKGRECKPALRPELSRPRWLGSRARSTAPAHPRPGAADARERLAQVNPEPRPEQYRLGSKALQESATSFLPDPGRRPDPDSDILDAPAARYNVLAVGYAPDIPGVHPLYPISGTEMAPSALYDWLELLPWTTRSWWCGDRIDAMATSATSLNLNARYFGSGRGREILFGWLARNVDRATGGAPPRGRAAAAGRRLQRDPWRPCPVCRSGVVSAGDD